MLSFGSVGVARRKAIDAAVDAVDAAAGAGHRLRWRLLLWLWSHSPIGSLMVAWNAVVDAAVDLHLIRLVDGLLLANDIWRKVLLLLQWWPLVGNLLANQTVHGLIVATVVAVVVGSRCKWSCHLL